jgi:large subunit ribosomal protein L17
LLRQQPESPHYPSRAESGSKEIIMRHRKGGFKLGRNTSHRRALLRNLVTSVILNDRIHTTVTKAKASKPIVEKMITLGKNGSVHARRQALAYMMTPESVDRLFKIVAPRYETRPGGYSRIIRTGVRQGDAAETAYLELLDAETELSAKAEKRSEARKKRNEELQKQMEESNNAAGGDSEK